MEKPQWLTRSYMEDSLRSHYKDPELIVTKCDFGMAIGKGENFGSILIKALVDYESRGSSQSKSYIVKTSFENDEFARQTMEPYDIFNREISIYKNLLPKLNKLKQEADIDDELFCTAVRVDYKRSALVFEDLTKLGFVMADRIRGLDMNHAKMILRKLALLHATSAVLNERERGCLESYDRGFFNRHTDVYRSYFVGNLEACSRLVSQWPEYMHYGKKLHDLIPHYMEIGKCCFEPTIGHVNVLCHGDLWTNNVMFRYDTASGRPLDAVLIDFQYSVWGSPALDLHYFVNTSVMGEMRLNRQAELFQYYHVIFIDTLRKLHYHSNPIPSLHHFLLQAEEKRFYALHSSCIIQPVMINEETEDADFNALMAEDERALKFKNTVYKNKIVQRNLRQLLPMFDRRGLLDSSQCKLTNNE